MVIRDFQRIVIAPYSFPKDGGTVEICGRNGAGKSSILKAIEFALRGATAAPDVPVRAGAKKADVQLLLAPDPDDMVGSEQTVLIKRTVDENGTHLYLTDRAGRKLPGTKPQAFLDRFWNAVAIDAAEFARQDEKKQAATLRQLTGLDTSALDAERQQFYADRTEVHRAIKLQEARLGDYGNPPPTDRVSITDLAKQLSNANAHNLAVERHERTIRLAETTIQNRVEKIESLIRETESVRSDLAQLRDKLADLEGARSKPIATDPLIACIQNAERINTAATLYGEWKSADEALRANRSHAEQLTASIDQIDQERRDMLAAIEFPVEGLSIDETGAVTFNGLPFSQASTAEQLRVGLAIAAALKPGLKLAVIRDGSLLDANSMAMVDDWAEANGYHVLIERVADSLGGPGIVIEEGRVKETC
jgi:DNA repair exonuclease SbcCD ATPase subunit